MKQKMNYARISRTVSLLSLIVFACCGTARAQIPTFTYQGSLTDGGSPANDTYEMQFSLFGSLAGNDQIGSTITHSSVAVTNGVFTVQLDFSPATPFATGADRWLAIAVRKVSGPPGFTALSPRQQITSSPYSIRTLSANVADALSSACVGCVNDSNVSDTLTLGATSTVSDSALSAQVARLNGAQTITGDWINTTNPWADNEISDTLTIGTGSTVSDAALSPNVMRATGATMTGPLNMNNSVISNIGAAGTDFSATGGLTLASSLQLAAGETISNVTNTITFANGATSSLSLNLGNADPSLIANTSSDTNLELGANGSVIVNLDENNNSSSSTFSIETNNSTTDLVSVTESGMTTILANDNGALRVANFSGSSNNPILDLYSDAALATVQFRVGRNGQVTVFGPQVFVPQSQSVIGTTVIVAGSFIALNPSGTAVENLTGGVNGQILIIRAIGAVTITDNNNGAGNIKLNADANYAMIADDTLQLVFDGINWLEISRSVN